jgi:hypothetical protein
VPSPGAPEIHLKLFALMGGMEVARGRKLSKKERRLAKAEAEEERQIAP